MRPDSRDPHTKKEFKENFYKQAFIPLIMAEKKGAIKKEKNVKNIISIILGSISVLLSFFFPYVVFLTATVGMILAYIERNKEFAKSNTWAFVLNLVGFFLSSIVLILAIFAIIIVGNNPDLLNALNTP